MSKEEMKIRAEIERTKTSIEWEDKKVEGYMEEIKKIVDAGVAYNVMMFVPGKIEWIRTSIEKKREYEERISMLEYLLREE